MIFDIADRGVAGLVSVAANVWSHVAHEYVKQCLNHELSLLSFQRVTLESRRKPVQMKGNDMKSSTDIWQQACKALFIASNPIPTKALLHDIGLIEHKTVRLPLSTEDLPSIKKWRQVTAWMERTG